ncbi:small serum protein 5-like [Sceloporus undulatus]|uniref:small serum protein 5-like n=1 Tax=Sceloporus undulatus TaxID=8520 RepID=UPI001C4C6851|nr:small serum protein 5-like [Sceloporus undulatus]
MKSLLCLTAMCIMLSVCSGFCFRDTLKMKTVDGKSVMPDECIDVFDESRHPIGSVWNSAECMRCSCGTDGMECCARYGGTATLQGCRGIVDPETCEHKFFEDDDPTKPCLSSAS